MQQIQFANRVKKTENRNRKNKKHVEKPKILHNLDRTQEYKSFLDVMGIYLKQNHYENVHWKTLLQMRYRGSSPTAPILFLSVAIFNN